MTCPKSNGKPVADRIRTQTTLSNQQTSHPPCDDVLSCCVTLPRGSFVGFGKQALRGVPCPWCFGMTVLTAMPSNLFFQICLCWSDSPPLNRAGWGSAVPLTLQSSVWRKSAVIQMAVQELLLAVNGVRKGWGLLYLAWHSKHGFRSVWGRPKKEEDLRCSKADC